VRLVDSHCHLQSDRFRNDVDLVLGGARLAGVERILVPGWDLASSAAALALVDDFPWLDPAVGIHPHEAAGADEAGWASIERLAVDQRVVAIGETGLDFDRVFAPVDAQLENLRRNLALALKLGKPAIIHCRSAEGRRDAQDALLVELRNAGFGSPGARAAFGSRPAAVIHSYSGPRDFGEAALGMGLAISFSGLVFRAGEEASGQVATVVPENRLLVETDSPFLSPPGAPRKRNEPEWVRITTAWLAEQRGADETRLGERLVRAYDAIFGTSGSRLTPPERGR
jgi:TatD DNase family protein